MSVVSLQISNTEVLDLDALVSVLSQEEQRRAHEFSHVQSRRTFIGARALLRIHLSKVLDLPPAGIPIEIDCHGKPFVAGHQAQFSLSHSHDVIAVAWSQDRAIGVDLERLKSVRQLTKISQRIFNWEDQKILAESENPLSLFFHLWTRYEAALKLMGKGFQDKADFSNMSLLSLSESHLPKHFFGHLAVQGTEAFRIEYI